jgi:transposase
MRLGSVISRTDGFSVGAASGRGKTVLEAVKEIGVTEQTSYRWKKKFGRLLIDQAKRLEDLERKTLG